MYLCNLLEGRKEKRNKERWEKKKEIKRKERRKREEKKQEKKKQNVVHLIAYAIFAIRYSLKVAATRKMKNSRSLCRDRSTY